MTEPDLVLQITGTIKGEDRDVFIELVKMQIYPQVTITSEGKMDIKET